MLNDKEITRRDLLMVGSLGAAGVLFGQMALTKDAFGAELLEPKSLTPKIKATLTEASSGKSLARFDSSAQGLMALNPIDEAPSFRVLNLSQERIGGELLQTADIKISFPTTADVLENAQNSGYVEEIKESGDDLAIYAKVILGVNWGTNKTTIQIQRGTFEVSSNNPLISYSNTAYAMMQKIYYKSSFFSGVPTTITTGWPVDTFNSSTDEWTCGGAVIGSGFNMLTGINFNYQVEIYLV